MEKLFGTDGIRGVAGEPPLDARTLFAVGRALGESLPRASAPARVLLGQDTRESSPWVASCLAGGLRAAGAEAVSAGVLPTPAIAHLVCAQGFAAGAVVSASHNPYRDNGIKLLAPTGTKFPDETEAQLETRIRALAEPTEGAPATVTPPVDAALAERYLEWLQAKAGALRLDTVRIILDCAHGAAFHVAPELFRRLGAEVIALHAAPDGKNINAGCGALHPDALARAVIENRAALGVAFDGDADRAIFVAPSGQVVNGDGTLLLCSRWLKQRGQLKTDTVVGTVMANLGFERALRAEGIALARTAVGDRYVLEEMQRRGSNLGGEQSGHIIFLDDALTGDGLLTALKVCAILRETGRSLDDLTAGLKVFPQALRNLRVREKVPLENLPQLQEAIATAERSLGDRGRILVRYSGTEPLLRIMVEAETDADVARWTESISAAVRAALSR